LKDNSNQIFMAQPSPAFPTMSHHTACGVTLLVISDMSSPVRLSVTFVHLTLLRRLKFSAMFLRH